MVDYPKPKNIHEVRAFLGFVGFYRKFIANFAKIAKPLTDLTRTKSKTDNGHERDLTGEDPMMVDASPVNRRDILLTIVPKQKQGQCSNCKKIRHTLESCRDKSTPKVKLKGLDELKAGNIE